ncbi:MAG: response regulator [Burkholderiaceae bacterium]
MRLPRLALGAEAAGDVPNPTASHSEAAFSGRRILLVDDNADLRDAMSFLLADLGFEVAVACGPMEALALAPGFRPDVALLDIGLPVMDGYRLAREMRRLFPSGPPRLVAMSGYGQPSDRLRSADAGFERHLVKPVAFDELVEVLHALQAMDATPTDTQPTAE